MLIQPYLTFQRGYVRVSHLTMINAVLFITEIGCRWPALLELSKRYGVQAKQISICKRAPIENMATAFTKRGTQTEKGSFTKVEKLHSKIGQ